MRKAPVMEIADFLTKYYMKYWQDEISLQLGTQRSVRVFSAFLPEDSTHKNMDKLPNNSGNEPSNFGNFTDFITPPRLNLPQVGPPPLKQIRRIKGKNPLVGPGSSSPSLQNYSPPPTSSQPPKEPRNKGEALVDIATSHYHQQDGPENNASDINTETASGDSDKENIPPSEYALQ